MLSGRSAPESILSITDVSRSYTSDAETVWAVRDANLTARAGEFVCVFGASGSGKSTLINIIAGLDSADFGEILVDAQDVARLDESERASMRLQTVGVVFQEFNLIEEFTAIENVTLPLEALGVGPTDAAGQAAIQMARVGLEGLEDRLPSQLSGGQRQRVGIARALVGDRRILLADEPTGSLDSAASVELFALLRELCDGGALAVVCSHDARCPEFADTVYEMVDGRPTLQAPAPGPSG